MQKAELLARFGKTADDKLLLARLIDKAALCLHKSIPTEGDFLSPPQKALVLSVAPHLAVRPVLWGGYEAAEREMVFFLPDYMEEPPADALSLLVAEHRDTRPLSHRDYLGSLLGLGVKREGVGDILVEDRRAQIIIRASLADFFLTHYTTAGRVRLSVSLAPLSALSVPESDPTYKTVSLASLRADAVLAAAYGVSRSTASEAICAGRVFLNSLPLLKSDKLLTASDMLRWQGKGRFSISEIGGKSRKGRFFVTLRF